MDNPSTLVVLVNTASEEEAVGIARTIVDERLAACANIVRGVRSIYRWQGKVEDETETTMIIKTVPERLSALTKRIVELHSYDVPEVIALAVVGGHAPYLDWVSENSNGSA